MIFQNAFDHILAPVAEYEMQSLRNAALCGVMAFAFIIVGVNQLITLIAYLFTVAFVCVTAWLYSLAPDIRGQVLRRIRDVLRMLWRRCVDSTFDEDHNQVKENKRQCRNVLAENEILTDHHDEAIISDDIPSLTAKEDQSRRIDQLAEGFTGLFNIGRN